MAKRQSAKAGISLSAKAEPIDDIAYILLVKTWRIQGWGDKEILIRTGKSTNWLRDTCALAGLDDHTFEALRSGEINRSVAIRLACIPDTEERLKRLHLAREIAAQRIEAYRAAIEADQNESERTLRKPRQSYPTV